jgi:uncharacterized protein (TIGR02118 family)
MILRSGLIANKPQIDQGEFRRHWLEVHGPLAARLPGLRRYAQNHVIEQLSAKAVDSLHPIDGLSQLWYDDIPAMVKACDSPENQRCIEDIQGYFSHVTILVLQQHVAIDGPVSAVPGSKVFVVLVGEDAANTSYRAAMKAFLNRTGECSRYVQNDVIDRNFIVDERVARSAQVVTGYAEIWFNSPGAAKAAVKNGLLRMPVEKLAPAVAVAVQENQIV